MDGVELVRVGDAAGLAVCEEMFLEYVSWVVAEFRARYALDFSAEKEAATNAELRRAYPKLLGESGRVVLVTVRGEPAAVGALKPLSEDESELKRIYVRAAFRGRGLGRRVVEYLVGEARALGYRSVQLDTVDFMAKAHQLYRSVGFVDCPPYPGEAVQNGVSDRALFMSLDLTRERGTDPLK